MQPRLNIITLGLKNLKKKEAVDDLHKKVLENGGNELAAPRETF